VVSDEAEAGACSSSEPARAARLPAVRDALEPHLQLAFEIGDLPGALAAVAKPWMHIEPERRLPAAHIAGLVELDRYSNRHQNQTTSVACVFQRKPELP
jgi:hypothetical protein